MRLDVEIPEGAEERAWRVVRAAFEQREPAPRERRPWKPALVLAAAAAVAGVVASPPGRAVLGSIREAVGVERAQPALFSLPAPGSLLVQSSSGPWVVRADGSKRRLGEWREASWSPFGRYVVAAREHELAALEPNGDVRWSLARRAVRFPRWHGTQVDTRIAYLAGSRLHVVAGDGTGDVDAGGLPAAAPVAPAWRPGLPFLVAYADTRGRVYAYELRGALRWRSAPVPGVRRLEWSSDGALLLALGRGKLVLLGGGKPLAVRFGRFAAAAFRPGTHEVSFIRSRGGAGEVVLGRRVLFRGTGDFRDLAWSPDGRWLLVTWPTADQWVFVRVARPRRILAVSDVTRQFGGGAFPKVTGWCCSS